MQADIYRMDKQQRFSCIEQGINYIQYPVINHSRKEYEKEYIYICMIESLCYTAVINIVIQLCFNKK